MARIIRSSENSNDSVSDFEHVVLEVIGSDHPDGKDYLDPAAILAQGREEAERKVREAYEEGLKRGTEAGKKKFDASVAQAEQLLNNASEALKTARTEFVNALEPQLVHLATAIASQILRREAELAPDLLQSTTRSALEHILDQERVTLHVNPIDLDVLRQQRVELLHEFDGISQLEILADESISPGGCIATSEKLHADAQIETQIEKILDRMTER